MEQHSSKIPDIARRASARITGLAAGTIFLFALPIPALSASFSETFAFDPPQWEFGDTDIQLGGLAAGALFASSQGGGPSTPAYDHSGATGLVTGNIRLRRILDNGMVLGARADILAYRDALSSDNYGNDTVQKLYVFTQMGIGRVEMGQQDGASYQLGLRGPIVTPQLSLQNRSLSLFRDPTTGSAFAPQPAINVSSTSNYAKITYVSPRLFGVQAGLSFTPQTVRSPLPFTGNPSDAANQQEAIFEGALSYTGYFSDLAVGLSGSFAQGALKNRTSGFADLYDWALGTQLAYTLDDIKLSVGGAYRVTNAYLLDVAQALKQGETAMLNLSAMAERGSWLFGIEYSHANAEGPVNHRMLGYQIAAGYKVNANLQITAGWQWRDQRRNLGSFYNGLPLIGMDAGFLSVGYSL